MGSITSEAFKAAMASFGAGVTVVTTLDGAGRPQGLTATAFSSVSREPPLCLVCVSLAAEAHPAIRATGKFAVNVLAREQEALSARFATHGLDKFDAVPWTPGPATGCPLLRDTLAAIECDVTQTIAAGDHDVFLGLIRGIELGQGEPLAYFRGRYCDLVPR